MTEQSGVWGAGPTRDYEKLAARFRPVFRRIRDGAVQREIDRTLPFEQIRWLKEAGFGAVRVPRDHGGSGTTLPELFALLTELAEADSNIAQALRAHFAYVEDVLNSKDDARRDRWFKRFRKGDIVGSAWTEVGEAKMAAFSTLVSAKSGRLVLNGAKYYTTGSIFADWVDVGAVNDANETVSVVVSATAPGVDIIDDWDGFGQRLTGSGTATFTDVPVEPEQVVAGEERFGYSAAFVQQVHLATLVGIARAASADAAKAVAERRRTYSHAAATRSSEDPQVLQVIGHVHSLSYAAGAVALKAAEALQRSFDHGGAGDAADAANVAAEIEIAQAQTVVSALTLEATAALFDALGASATSRSKSFDRYWRNARTIASHNPRIYKDRIVGDYVVNGTPPPFQWRIGQA
ncbi:acyl-CoA dehydrogenase family protein [Methylocapsa sp. S129]|uniref:acyl-CoA dehydrogenase family protein n=1 Tax=Methylocapsa sp. S129 TaxID=1641869 RepID=UPI00131A7C6B|nr:acyl-CoA dehydrogenase family protein [Methylocapsa sp. S129]